MDRLVDTPERGPSRDKSSKFNEVTTKIGDALSMLEKEIDAVEVMASRVLKPKSSEKRVNEPPPTGNSDLVDWLNEVLYQIYNRTEDLRELKDRIEL